MYDVCWLAERAGARAAHFSRAHWALHWAVVVNCVCLSLCAPACVCCVSAGRPVSRHSNWPSCDKQSVRCRCRFGFVGFVVQDEEVPHTEEDTTRLYFLSSSDKNRDSKHVFRKIRDQIHADESKRERRKKTNTLNKYSIKYIL